MIAKRKMLMWPFFWLGLILILSSCGPDEERINELAQTQAAEQVAEAVNALPTATLYPTQEPYPSEVPPATPLPLATQTPLPSQSPYDTATPYPTYTLVPSPTITETPVAPTAAPSSGGGGVVVVADIRQAVIDRLVLTRDLIGQLIGLLGQPVISCSQYVNAIDQFVGSHQPIDVAGQPLELQQAYGLYLDIRNKLQDSSNDIGQMAQDCRDLLAADPAATVPQSNNTGAALVDLKELEPQVHNLLRLFGVL